VVTDSAADLPDDELGPALHPHGCGALHFGDRSYLDKVGITARSLRRDRAQSAASEDLAAAAGDFRRQFEFLGSHFDSVVSVNLTRQASGTCGAAEAAATRVSTHGKVTVVDSMNASVGQGLVAMYAAECAQAGYDAARVIDATRAILPRTRTFGLSARSSTRARRPRAALGQERRRRAAADAVLHADRKAESPRAACCSGANGSRRSSRASCAGACATTCPIACWSATQLRG